MGLDPSALRAALTAGHSRPIVWREHLEATDQGIHGIPAILIPGQAPIVGAVPYAELKRAVEHALLGGAGGPRVDPDSGALIFHEGSAFS